MRGMEGGETHAKRLQSFARAKLPEVEATLERARVMHRVLRAAQSCQCSSIEQCFVGLRRAGLA